MTKNLAGTINTQQVGKSAEFSLHIFSESGTAGPYTSRVTPLVTASAGMTMVWVLVSRLRCAEAMAISRSAEMRTPAILSRAFLFHLYFQFSELEGAIWQISEERFGSQFQIETRLLKSWRGTFFIVRTYHTEMSVVPGWRVCGGSKA